MLQELMKCLIAVYSVKTEIGARFFELNNKEPKSCQRSLLIPSTKDMEGQSHSLLINKRLRYVARVDEVPHHSIFREDGNWSKIFRFEQQATQIMLEKFAHSFYQSHGRAITQLADQ